MRVENRMANFRRAEQRITTSLRTKFRFYESYWLFYCLRIHWFFSLIVFSTDAGRGKAASNWCADSTDISMKKGSKNRYLAGWSNQGHAAKSCSVRGVTQTCWATLPPSCSAAGRRTLVSRTEGFWSFCIGIHFLYLQRPWKGMSNSSICVYVLDLFLLHWHEAGISASRVQMQTRAQAGCWKS